jgi:hypothetical protein
MTHDRSAISPPFGGEATLTVLALGCSTLCGGDSSGGGGRGGAGHVAEREVCLDRSEIKKVVIESCSLNLNETVVTRQYYFHFFDKF